jgi:hypothetical protein
VQCRVPVVWGRIVHGRIVLVLFFHPTPYTIFESDCNGGAEPFVIEVTALSVVENCAELRRLAVVNCQPQIPSTRVTVSAVIYTAQLH